MIKGYESRIGFNVEAIKLSQLAARATQPLGPKWQEAARRAAIALRKQLRELEMVLEQEAKDSFER